MKIENLSSYFNRIDLIRDTANQIIKDFDLFGFNITFSGNAYTAYEELFNQMEPHINQLINKNQQKFMSVLYRIDVSENQLKKAVQENTSESFSEIVCDLIIKRELQKVVIRNYYKSKVEETKKSTKRISKIKK